MNNFRVGHYSDLQRGTGCTVIICPEGTKASAYARGVSPGTREYALLSPFRKVEEIHGLLLTGGSAFGLDAAAGIMQYLYENRKGYLTTYGRIPIVPGAVIFDLPVADSTAYPKPENAYLACKNAISNNKDQGTVGAGTGATVGKWAGLEYMMKGGIGIANIENNSVWVNSLSVVNSVGDVVNKSGEIIAGAQKKGKFIGVLGHKTYWERPEVGLGENTVLVTIMTNAELQKINLHYIAERAHNGIVRAIQPAHTTYDGDIVFTLTTGEKAINLDTFADMCIEATRVSIINAVTHATSLHNIPSLKSLTSKDV